MELSYLLFEMAAGTEFKLDARASQAVKSVRPRNVAEIELDLCENYCKVFGKKFQAIIIFEGRSSLDRFRCLARF